MSGTWTADEIAWMFTLLKRLRERGVVLTAEALPPLLDPLVKDQKALGAVPAQDFAAVEAACQKLKGLPPDLLTGLLESRVEFVPAGPGTFAMRLAAPGA
jgi:hypothetical protein